MIVITLSIFHCEISGKDFREEQPRKVVVKQMILYLLKYDNPDMDVNFEQLKNILFKSIVLTVKITSSK